MLDDNTLVAQRDLLLDWRFDHIGANPIAALACPLADRQLFADDRDDLFTGSRLSCRSLA